MLNTNGTLNANGSNSSSSVSSTKAALMANGTGVTNGHNSCNSLVPSKALMLTNGSGLYKVFSTESVLNLLHCLFCRKPYRDPRLLHCGHTYCLPCLVQMNRYSTIRCIKCNSLHTVTSHAVDTLPKNLFVADIQCIPTVEIDRGAAYKETLKSLEDLKAKLLDFSDKFDQSEDKLLQVSQVKRNEVTEQINKMLEYIKQLEEEFYSEIEEFKNNRLSVLRSAPPEFKETNANLLQFVNQSLDDMMRPDIKEEDVKEIYNRCEEHRRLWNETEIIFNSNYAIGEIHFQINENRPQKDLIGAIVQKFPQKLNAQRTAKGPINISECCVDGDYIIIENTSKRHDVNMTNWVLTHCVGSVRKVSFKFPENFILKFKQSCKLWAGTRAELNGCSSPSVTSTSTQSNNKFAKSSYSGTSSQSSSSSSISSKSTLNGNHHTNSFYINGNGHSPATASTTSANSTTSSSTNSGSSEMILTDSIENELVIYDIENWTCGSQEMFIRIENEFGEEKACFRKTN